jgi:hypothetical protein
VYGDQGAIISTGTLDPAQLRLVQLLQRVEIVGERYNVLRHVLRWLQWDCDVPASDVYDQIVHLVVAEPERYPLIAWTFGYFEFFGTVPVGRTAFYQEVERFVVETYGVEPSSELRTVLAVQHHLCPAPGRRFPDTLQLDHDYVSYACDALEPLYVDGEPGTPPRPLREHGPGTLVVLRDPLQLCDDGLVFPGDSRDPLMEGDFLIGNVSANELDSPLLRYLPAMVPVDLVDPMLARPAVQEAASRTQPDDVEDDETVGVLSIPVRLAPRVRAH